MFFFVVSLFLQDGAVILKTITNDWGANLTPSPKKTDFVYTCVSETGANTKVKINGVTSYKCVPGKGCKKHQCHFQAHSTSHLFRMFCKGHPALAPIVHTECIYRKLRLFFAAKPTLRWEMWNMTDFALKICLNYRRHSAIRFHSDEISPCHLRKKLRATILMVWFPLGGK